MSHVLVAQENSPGREHTPGRLSRLGEIGNLHADFIRLLSKPGWSGITGWFVNTAVLTLVCLAPFAGAVILVNWLLEPEAARPANSVLQTVTGAYLLGSLFRLNLATLRGERARLRKAFMGIQPFRRILMFFAAALFGPFLTTLGLEALRIWTDLPLLSGLLGIATAMIWTLVLFYNLFTLPLIAKEGMPFPSGCVRSYRIIRGIEIELILSALILAASIYLSSLLHPIMPFLMLLPAILFYTAIYETLLSHSPPQP